jgi:hypothetical protein
MLTPIMAKLVYECSDDDLDALTELINTERKRRWRLWWRMSLLIESLQT